MPLELSNGTLCQNNVCMKISLSDFQPPFSHRIEFIGIISSKSIPKIVKIPRNSVLPYENEIQITYGRLFCKNFIDFYQVFLNFYIDTEIVENFLPAHVHNMGFQEI